MTDELIMQLITAGLTKQQATSVTARTLTDLYMQEDGKILIAEARRQVDEMRKTVRSLQRDYDSLKEKLDAISGTLISITEAQEQYGSVSDDTARNVIALYGALLNMGRKAGADSSEAVSNAGYILYAYLGGQAKREVSYNKEIQ